MEIKVESVDNSLPPKCYVGIRSGGVQKQAPHDPKTRYRFSDAKRFSKVDIFQRIGTCDIAWSGDDTETRTCQALDANKCETPMRMKVSMTRVGLNPKMSATAPLPSKAGDISGGSAQANIAKAETAVKSAKYISEHRVEDILTTAMKALLKHVPDDAPAFLCDFIAQNYGKREGGHLTASTKNCGGEGEADGSGLIVPAGEAKPQAAHSDRLQGARAEEKIGSMAAYYKANFITAEAPGNHAARLFPTQNKADSEELTPRPPSPAAALFTDWLSDLPDKFQRPSGSEADLSNLIESFQGATLDEVTECLSGVPPGRLKKLEKVSGVQLLIESLQGTMLDEVAECLSAVPLEELKKLEKRQGVHLVAPAEVRLPAESDADLSNLIESLQGATLDQVAECLSGVPPGEVKTLEKLGGVQLLSESLNGATLDRITECLSGVPPAECKKLEKRQAVQPVPPGCARKRNCPRHWSAKADPQSSQEPEADLSDYIESLQDATLGEIEECLSGIPPGELKKFEKLGGVQLGALAKVQLQGDLKSSQVPEALIESLKGAALNELVKIALIERLKGATLDEAAECLSGVPLGELEKLEKLAGHSKSSQVPDAERANLIESLQGATLDGVADCLSGVPLGDLKKLEKLGSLKVLPGDPKSSQVPDEALRQKARGVLLNGSANGTLAELLSKTSAVRQKARGVLLNGLANGTLAESVSKTSHLTGANAASSAKPAATGASPVNPYSYLTTRSGDLMPELRPVQDAKSPEVAIDSSASIALKDAAEQLNLPLQAKPSVATWYRSLRSTRVPAPRKLHYPESEITEVPNTDLPATLPSHVPSSFSQGAEQKEKMSESHMRSAHLDQYEETQLGAQPTSSNDNHESVAVNCEKSSS